MKTFLVSIIGFFVLTSSSACAISLDDVLKGVQSPGSADSARGLNAPDQKTTISGLKEALSIGTRNAVGSVSKMDGYFGNELIKILLPDKLQKVADVIGKLGYQQQVDQLVLAMNRAAETAAPKAVPLFTQAIKEMSFDDARRILQGGDTAATDFFKGKTSKKLYDQFKPVVTSSMNKVGVAKAYKDMVTPYQSLPFASKESMDLDHYVTNEALDGLFTMVGEEEKKIRTNPAARVTDLLKKVFTK
ncbi:MAG: DUF4197 domain-containing protein [Deltaproteobacteria bacterium HGW-Deltaproteobacteria-21]|nr:MAG: DUF4197 domain-containing protein [Deltaproteobacteria bacterium HGW-Deltaproteobacteria-21]